MNKTDLDTMIALNVVYDYHRDFQKDKAKRSLSKRRKTRFKRLFKGDDRGGKTTK